MNIDLSNQTAVVTGASSGIGKATAICLAKAGAKVFTGDIQQIDSPYLDTKSNGLSYLADRMKGQDIFAHVHLIKGERSYLADLASNLL